VNHPCDRCHTDWPEERMVPITSRYNLQFRVCEICFRVLIYPVSVEEYQRGERLLPIGSTPEQDLRWAGGR